MRTGHLSSDTCDCLACTIFRAIHAHETPPYGYDINDVISAIITPARVFESEEHEAVKLLLLAAGAHSVIEGRPVKISVEFLDHDEMSEFEFIDTPTKH